MFYAVISANVGRAGPAPSSRGPAPNQGSATKNPATKNPAPAAPKSTKSPHEQACLSLKNKEFGRKLELTTASELVTTLKNTLAEAEKEMTEYSDELKKIDKQADEKEIDLKQKLTERNKSSNNQSTRDLDSAIGALRSSIKRLQSKRAQVLKKYQEKGQAIGKGIPSSLKLREEEERVARSEVEKVQKEIKDKSC
jgi:hypothetical protein